MVTAVPEEPLQVEVVRSGGFGGVRRNGRVNTADLEEERAATLRALVAEAGLPDRTLPQPAPGGPDRFQYDITLVRGSDRRSITCHEPDLSPAGKRLVDWVLAGGSDLD